MSHFFYEKETVTCGRKEKLENVIGENLSLEKRKKEKRPARRKNSPEMKDDSQDRLRQIYLSAHTRSQYLISRQQESANHSFRVLRTANFPNAMCVGLNFNKKKN